MALYLWDCLAEVSNYYATHFHNISKWLIAPRQESGLSLNLSRAQIHYSDDFFILHFLIFRFWNNNCCNNNYNIYYTTCINNYSSRYRNY